MSPLRIKHYFEHSSFMALTPAGCNSLQVLQEALTVISLLDVLCEMTSDHKQFMFLQDHPDLLVTAVGNKKTHTHTHSIRQPH